MSQNGARRLVSGSAPAVQRVAQGQIRERTDDQAPCPHVACPEESCEYIDEERLKNTPPAKVRAL